MFEIKDIECTYDGQKTVLSIPELNLSSGKLYFFIGASGVGKSTLLEALGMMNYPLKQGKGKLHFVDGDQKTDMHKQWKLSDEAISSFRQKHFSFIFQNTNLMPHYTAGENMCYTLLLEGMSWEAAAAKVKAMMPSLSLDVALFDRPVQQLSGGQRQRLAFVRAFVSSFDVLFGDEPTGNLDPITAKNLMQILKDYIVSHHKSAVVVSHDITLATEFAHRIYYLRKNDVGEGGILKSDQYFENVDGQWFHHTNKVGGNVMDELHQYLKA